MASDKALIFFLSMVMGRANSENLTSVLPSFVLVQMFSRRQFREFLEMFGAQGIGNGVFFTEPFPQVNQLATARAKGAGRTGEPIPYPLACRTFDLHCDQNSTV